MPTTGTEIEARHLEILRDIRQPILFALSRSFRNAYVAVVDQLVEQIVLETSWERQDQLNASLDLLRNGKASIEQQFETACARNWKRRTGVSADGSYSMPEAVLLSDEPPTLRLVDDDTMRDQLLVARISARARRRMDEELADGLRARFGALLGQDWFAENEYPIAPDIIFEILREIFTAHQGQTPRQNASTTSFLLDLFEPKLTVELIETYQDVNRQLIARGVLPELRYSIAKSRGSQQAGAFGQEGEGGATEDAQGEGSSGRAGGAGSARGLGAVEVSEAELGRWADQIGTVDSHERSASLAQATRYLADPRNFGQDGQVAAHRQAASDQLMAVLNELQARTEEANSPEDMGVLVQEVRQQSSAAAQSHGTPLDRLIVETVAQVFQHVYEDDAIANAIKQQLLRLQVAAFKAALIDASFFARPDHPMRRFVDRLAEMGSDPDFETEPGSPLVNATEALVTWVLNNFERELVVIAEALDRTEKIIAEETARRDERLQKIAEAASRAERIDLLRQEIRQGMRTRIGAGGVPESIQHFAEHAWTEVIVRLRDETGELPFDEARAQRVLETLIWSVQPKKATDIKELAKTLPQLIADLSRGLAFIAMPSNEREAFFKELMATHGKVIEQSKHQPASSTGQTITAKHGATGRAGQPGTPATQAHGARPSATAPAASQTRPAGTMAAAASRTQPATGASATTQAHQTTAAPATAQAHQTTTAPATGPMRTGSAPGSAIAASPSLAASTARAAGTMAGPATRPMSDGSTLQAAQPATTGGTPGVADDYDPAWDEITRNRLAHGDEIERDIDGETRRYKLGWVSPSATVYIFSRYPREHWTVNRRQLHELMVARQVRVVRKPASTAAAIDALQAA